MEFYEIKFSFKHDLIDEKHLDIIFNNMGKLLDVRFDENLNHYRKKMMEKSTNSKKLVMMQLKMKWVLFSNSHSRT